MSLLILMGFVCLFGLLVVSGTIRVLRPTTSRSPRFVWVLPAIGVALSLSALLDGRSAALPIPVGFAGSNGGIQLDQLSALFLLLAFLAASFVDMALPPSPRQRGLLRLCLAGLMLTMLAGDGFLLAVGGVLTILALGRTGGGIGTGRIQLLAGTGLIGATTALAGLASPSDALLADANFSLIRGAVIDLDGFAGGFLLPVLTLLAALPLLGAWPLHGWHRRLYATGPLWTPLLATLLGLFVLLRLLLDLSGPAPPAGWGMVLILLGLAGALHAAVAALSGARLRPAIGHLLAVPAGFAVTGTGICLLARAEELPALATTAFDAVLLILPVQILAGLGALALADAMESEAGAGALGRLGGLAQSMPRAALLSGACAALLGFLPPAGTFTGLWLLLQAAFVACRDGGAPAAPRIGSVLSGLSMPALVLAIVAGAVAAMLCLLGWLRLASVAVLGRPRTPRGAAALDIPTGLLRASCALLAIPLLIGLLPGLWLRVLGPLRALPGLDPGTAAPAIFRLVAPGGSSGLSPLPIMVLVALSIVLTGRARRFLFPLPARAVRHTAAWAGGAPPAPPWLPFGDPNTQVGPATLPRALRAAFGRSGPARATIPAAMRPALRATIETSRAASSGLSRLLQSQGGMLALGMLVLVLALFGWWRSA